MFIYLLLYASFPLFRRVKRNQAIWCISIELIMILILRHETLNVDYVGYFGGFEYISSLDLTDMLSRLSVFGHAKLPYPHKFESGWMILNWIIGKLNLGFRGFLVVHAIFCIATISRFIEKYSKNIWLSFALFVSLEFYSYMFGIMRQAMCMCILLHGIIYIKERKFWKFLLIVFLASSVHLSAIVFIPLYFLNSIRITRKRFLAICICNIVFIIVAPYVLQLFKPILSVMGYSSYLDSSFQWNNMLLLNAFFIPLCVYLFVDFAKFFENDDHNIIGWATLLATPVLTIGAISTVLGRCAQYYFIFVTLLIPNAIKQYNNKKTAYFAAGVVYILCGLFYIYVLSGSRYVPYISIFE